MKISPKQIAASCAGAVLSALIASLFGVSGTVIGVALGSAIATTTAALVAQSIERTHSAVQGVVVKAPRRIPLLRRVGSTAPSGGVETAATASALAEGPPASGVTGGPGAIEVEGPDASRSEAAATPTASERVPALGGEPTIEQPRLIASSRAVGRVAGGQRPAPPVAGRRSGELRWRTLALAIAAVFVVTLLLVTAVELVAGRPIASLFGASGTTGGTSAGNLFAPPTTTTSTTTTTTVPTTSTTTTTTTTTSTTTTTTVPTTTSTTVPTTTSTTGPTSTSTTTLPTTTTTTGKGAGGG